jgi:hypothetical protein
MGEGYAVNKHQTESSLKYWRTMMVGGGNVVTGSLAEHGSEYEDLLPLVLQITSVDQVCFDVI